MSLCHSLFDLRKTIIGSLQPAVPVTFLCMVQAVITVTELSFLHHFSKKEHINNAMVAESHVAVEYSRNSYSD